MSVVTRRSPHSPETTDPEAPKKAPAVSNSPPTSTLYPVLYGLALGLLIALGIWKKKLHLRIGAIVLFGLTLLKLFFYDLSSLNTISKTIVFVVLGILLLIISFLYTKYRKVIFEDKNE